MDPSDRLPQILVVCVQLLVAFTVFIVRGRFRSDASWILMGTSLLVLAGNRVLASAGAGQAWITLVAWVAFLLAVWIHLLSTRSREG